MSSSSETQLSTSSSCKCKPTPTVFYSNELQEVTSCTKETVRITPPPHDAVAQKPTVLTLDNTPNGTPYQCNRNARSSSLPKMSTDQRDKQCQTDDSVGSIISNDVSAATSKDTLSVSPATSGHNANLTEESSRELEHINVIVNECRSSADNISCNSVEMKKLKKDKDTPDHVVVQPPNLNSKVKFDDVKDIDIEEDTFCVKCFLGVLQICDCCHIS